MKKLFIERVSRTIEISSGKDRHESDKLNGHGPKYCSMVPFEVSHVGSRRI